MAGLWLLHTILIQIYKQHTPNQTSNSIQVHTHTQGQSQGRNVGCIGRNEVYCTYTWGYRFRGAECAGGKGVACETTQNMKNSSSSRLII